MFRYLSLYFVIGVANRFLRLGFCLQTLKFGYPRYILEVERRFPVEGCGSKVSYFKVLYICRLYPNFSRILILQVAISTNHLSKVLFKLTYRNEFLFT